MILKTKVLYKDVLADKFGTDEEEIWGDYYLNLNEIIGFGECIKDNIVREDCVEIDLKNGRNFVLNITIRELKCK